MYATNEHLIHGLHMLQKFIKDDIRKNLGTALRPWKLFLCITSLVESILIPRPEIYNNFRLDASVQQCQVYFPRSISQLLQALIYIQKTRADSFHHSLVRSIVFLVCMRCSESIRKVFLESIERSFQFLGAFPALPKRYPALEKIVPSYLTYGFCPFIET